MSEKITVYLKATNLSKTGQFEIADVKLKVCAFFLRNPEDNETGAKLLS